MATGGDTGTVGAETPSAGEAEASTPSIAQPHLAVQDLNTLVSPTKKWIRVLTFGKRVYLSVSSCFSARMCMSSVWSKAS